MSVSMLLLSVCITLFTCSAQQPTAPINQYNISRDADGTYRWVSLSDFIPQPATAYGSIPIGESMRMEFDFMFGGRSNTPVVGDWEMFFRVGFGASGGSNCAGQGARYPSLWLTDTHDTLHVSVSEGTTCQPQQSLSDYGTLAEGASYHIIIAFNQSELTVEIDGPTRRGYMKPWRRAPTQAQYLGEWAPVWFMSDRNADAELPYNTGRGTFSNIVLTSFTATLAPSTAPTVFQPPTDSPTKLPTLPTLAPATVSPSAATPSPSKTPTFSPSAAPTVAPTLLPTTIPTTAPTLQPTNIPSAQPTQSPETVTVRPTFAPLAPTKQPLQWGDIWATTTTTSTTEFVYGVDATQSTKEVEEEVAAVLQAKNSQQIELIIFGTVIGVCVCTVVVFLAYLKYKKKYRSGKSGGGAQQKDSPDYQLSVNIGLGSPDVDSLQQHMGMHNVYSNSHKLTKSSSKGNAAAEADEEDETKPLTHVSVHSKSITITAPAHQYHASNTSIGIGSAGSRSQPNGSYLLSPQTAAVATANINDLVCDLEKFQSDSINISVMKVSNEDPPTPAVSPNVLRASVTSPNGNVRNNSSGSASTKRTLPLVDKESSSKPRKKTKTKKDKSKKRDKSQHQKRPTDETLDAFVPESRPDSPAVPLVKKPKKPKSARSKAKQNEKEKRRTPRKYSDRIKSYDSNSNSAEAEAEQDEDCEDPDYELDEEEDGDDDDVKYDGRDKKKKSARERLKLTESPSFGKQKLRKPPKARNMSKKSSRERTNHRNKSGKKNGNKQSYQAVLPPPPYHEPSPRANTTNAYTAVDAQETYEEQSHSMTADSEEAYRYENANDGYVDGRHAGGGFAVGAAGDGDVYTQQYEHGKLNHNYKGMQQGVHVDRAQLAHMAAGNGGVTVAEGGGYEGDGVLAYTHYDGAGDMDHQMAVNAYGYADYGGYHAHRTPVQHVQHMQYVQQQQQQQTANQPMYHLAAGASPFYDTNDMRPQNGASGKKVGYDWIKKTLQRVDSRYHADYFRNFRKHRVKDDCLGDLLPEDWKELIPAIGPRNAFKRLWRLKFSSDGAGGGYEAGGGHGGVTGEFDYDDDDDTNTQVTDDVHSELLSEPGTVFSGNTSHTGYVQQQDVFVTRGGDDDDDKEEDDDDEYAESEFTEQTQETQEFAHDRKYESHHGQTQSQSLQKAPHKMDKHVSRPSNVEDYVHPHEADENASFQSHDDQVVSDDATETTGLTAAHTDDYFDDGQAERRRRVRRQSPKTLHRAQPSTLSSSTTTSKYPPPPGAAAATGTHGSRSSPNKPKTPGKYLDDRNDIENDANSFLSDVVSDDSGHYHVVDAAAAAAGSRKGTAKSSNHSMYSQSTYEEPPSTLGRSVSRPSTSSTASSSVHSQAKKSRTLKHRSKAKYQKQNLMNTSHMPAPIEEVDDEQDTDDMEAAEDRYREEAQHQQQRPTHQQQHDADAGMSMPHQESNALSQSAETPGNSTLASTEPMGSLEEENGHIADDECKTDAGTSLYSHSSLSQDMETLTVAQPTPNMISPPIPPQYVGNHTLPHMAPSKTLKNAKKSSRSSFSSRSSVSSHVSSWDGSEAPEPEVQVNREDLDNKPLNDVEEYSDEDVLGIPKFDAEVDASDDEDGRGQDSSDDDDDDDDDDDNDDEESEEEEEDGGNDDEFEEDEESSSSSKKKAATTDARTDEEEFEEEYEEDSEDDAEESVSQGLSQSQSREESEQQEQ